MGNQEIIVPVLLFWLDFFRGFFFFNVSLCGIKQGTAACVLPVLFISVLI